METICPVCNGKGRIPVPLEFQKSKRVIAGFNSSDDTIPCTNCQERGNGATRINGTGKTNVLLNGTGCIHVFNSVTIGSCYKRYSCKCGYSYEEDTSD